MGNGGYRKSIIDCMPLFPRVAPVPEMRPPEVEKVVCNSTCVTPTARFKLALITGKSATCTLPVPTAVAALASRAPPSREARQAALLLPETPRAGEHPRAVASTTGSMCLLGEREADGRRHAHDGVGPVLPVLPPVRAPAAPLIVLLVRNGRSKVAKAAA